MTERAMVPDLKLVSTNDLLSELELRKQIEAVDNARKVIANTIAGLRDETLLVDVRLTCREWKLLLLASGGEL